MDTTKLLGDIVTFSKYSKYLPSEGRRENWTETCQRNADMHARKYPDLADEIYRIYSKFVITKKVFPSMRSLQFGGNAIEQNNTRMFNCSALAIEKLSAFSEGMFLLLGGTGLGISVQSMHINKLPTLKGPKTLRSKRHVVEDSIMGWADAVKVLINSYFRNKMRVRFDFSEVRPKGAPLKTAGGKAPGPEPLKLALAHVTAVLENALSDRGAGTKLKSIEAFDIFCHIADAVLAGGIRRSAMVTLFSFNDNDMLNSKHGPWWELNPQRGRSNNSVSLNRKEISNEDFNSIWETAKASGCGEPGFVWTNNHDVLVNPCVEISLTKSSFCNLTTVDVSKIESQSDLNNRVSAAAFLGTLQAGYTDFHYLNDDWQTATEEDSLIGVSMTGIASGEVLKYDLREAADHAKYTNIAIATKIGINEAARVTCIKPEGTSSLVAGCSSGIHAYYAPYYVRRMRFNKDEPLFKYLEKKLEGTGLLEDDKFAYATTSILSVPIKSPEGAITRDESALDLLARVKLFQEEWIAPGHRDGDNHNNVSVTVSIKDDEWERVGKWMWDNRDIYTGISVLPYSGGTYQQAPFTDSDKEEFDILNEVWENVDFDISEVEEDDDNVSFGATVACSGGNCEITGV